MKKDKIKVELKTQEIEVPTSINVKILEKSVEFEKEGVKLKVNYNPVFLKMLKENDLIKVVPLNSKRKTKAMLNTISKLILNTLNGFDEPYVYKMTIVFSHFPITAKVEGDEIIVTNFLGEKQPRFSKILPNCKVDIKGRDITITSVDKTAAGQTAGNLEKATRVKNKDYRMFDDGCYIVEKPSKRLLSA